MSMNVWMKTHTTVRMNSINVSTLAARTSVNVNKTCTLSMGNAEVIGEGLERISLAILYEGMLTRLSRVDYRS